MLSGASAAWLAAAGFALLVFCSPVIAAAVRGTDRLGLVVLLTVLGLAGGVTWLLAWYAVFAMPRRATARPAPRAQASRRPPPGWGW